MSYPNTPNQFTNHQNISDPNNACFYGMANATSGLCQIGQINGIGLVTSGFVWSGPEIWFYVQEAQGLATNWTAAAGYSGAAAASLVTTAWTQSSAFGMTEYKESF